jgi:hypothetical protein
MWFTIFTSIAWLRGKYVAAAVLGLLAAVDIAFAVQILRGD